MPELFGLSERLLEDIKGQGFDIAGISADRLLKNWRLVRERSGRVGGVVPGSIRALIVSAWSSHGRRGRALAYLASRHKSV